VFSIIRVKLPTRKARHLKIPGDIGWIALITFIALKLTGIITWSWWWVLSPIWISGILALLTLAGLLGLLFLSKACR
jgi:hypothetical protein